MLEEIYLLYVSNTYIVPYEFWVCLGTFVFVGSGHVASMSYKIDHSDYSCDKVMKFEFFYEK